MPRACTRRRGRPGRDAATLGVEGFVSHAGESPEQWARRVEAYRAVGATHISFNTLWVRLKEVDALIGVLRKFREVV